MKLYNFNINNFEYQNGRKISRNVISTNDNQYYCTSKDMNAIADYLNGLKIQISGLTDDYNTNFLKISGDIYNDAQSGNAENIIEDALSFYPIKGVINAISLRINEYFKS